MNPYLCSFFVLFETHLYLRFSAFTVVSRHLSIALYRPVRILYPEVQYQRSFFTPLESEAAKPA
jgi:hypothetical protein